MIFALGDFISFWLCYGDFLKKSLSYEALGREICGGYFEGLERDSKGTSSRN
jgi:hypothetical protein